MSPFESIMTLTGRLNWPSPVYTVYYVDHSITDQSSIIRFIEDNWNLGRIGDQSFDTIASIESMFNFTNNHQASKLFLNPDKGTVDLK